MKTFEKYTENLRVVESNVYSYSTIVARIYNDKLIQLGYWSKTTQKHINYAAKELNLTLVKPSK